MDSLHTFALESNKKFKFNFAGGDLSSDAGLLLIKEFAAKIGFENLVNTIFKTNDTALFRRHTDPENLLQMIYQTIAAYHRDDCADELTHDPVMTAALEKDSLASQPTLSRFFSRMDEDTLLQMHQITRMMRRTIYSMDTPEHILLDLDSTLLDTYGNQEGEAFNYHYQAHGYHPLFCFDGLTGDLLKAQLRDGSQYCSKGSGQFMEDLLCEFQEDFPDTRLYMRGDSGFASPELYDVLESRGCKYAIRLKENSRLRELAAEKDKALFEATMHTGDSIKYAVTYGEFMYQAGSWEHPRRVVYKIEKPYGQMIHMFTFVVTTMEDLDASQVLRFYCGRGRMENFIKECKSGFGFTAVSSSSRIVNANRLQLRCLAYNLFNWFRRLTLPESMRRHCIDTLRIKLLKIAARVVHSARYIIFRLCSSCPYKQEFYETLVNIRNLQVQLE